MHYQRSSLVDGLNYFLLASFALTIPESNQFNHFQLYYIKFSCIVMAQLISPAELSPQSDLHHENRYPKLST
jgi:hypothetical protein